MLLFLAQLASAVLRALPSLAVLAGSITSWSTEVVGNCFIGLLSGFVLQPARVPPYPAPVAPHAKTHLDPSQVPVAAGRVLPSASQSQWAEIVGEGGV